MPFTFDALDPRLLIALGLLVLAALVLVALWVRRRARRAPSLAPPTPAPEALPPPRPRVELPPSDAERARREEAERAHEEAERLATERARLKAESRHAEASALKEQEEEKKREEYRARKAAEQEARDRRGREREEEARLAAEAEATRQRALEEEARRAAEADAVRVQAQAGQTLAQGLATTRQQGFVGRIQRLFGGAERRIDEAALGELEEILFTADIGVQTASRLVQMARERAGREALSSSSLLQGLIRTEVEKILELPQPRSLEGSGPPHVTMVIGVNGAGKTTTIGKLAAQRTARGEKVVIAAGDTFRAAAAEQLDVWADRAQAILVKGAENADPGSVVFDALKRAQAESAALVLVDTAGRLHTKVPLMEELKKVKRVMSKAQPDAPHEVLLVLDATVGQNAIAQAKQFHDAVGITGLVLTKLDGTAKGGVVIGICDALKIPIAWVGVGERIADLRRFDAREFVAALFDTN